LHSFPILDHDVDDVGLHVYTSFFTMSCVVRVYIYSVFISMFNRCVYFGCTLMFIVQVRSP